MMLKGLSRRFIPILLEEMEGLPVHLTGKTLRYEHLQDLFENFREEKTLARDAKDM
jgi:hypothetical protein